MRQTFLPIQKKIQPRAIIGFISIALVFGITAMYRFYQPVTHPALLQFDIFDWMTRSREVLVFGKMVAPTTLWFFPVVNAWIAKIFAANLFAVYLYSGAALTTLNLLILAACARLLWPRRILPMVLMGLLYGLNTQLLSRSVNYLPETMTYTFGLTLVYCYLYLFLKRNWKVIPAILVMTYLFYHLHQSGLNFIIFSSVALLLYVLLLAPLPFRWRALLCCTSILATAGLIFYYQPLREQFLFFLQGSKNADVAFQGNAIPFQQIINDYPLPLLVLMMIGVVSIIFNLRNKTPLGQKISLLMLLGISSFYFAFLYIFPNLGLYSLVPWRFYTWFSLYGVIIATIGGVAFIDRFRVRRGIIMGVVALLSITLFHGSLISDNMFTADAATLQEMSDLTIPVGSTVITTNANYLQTRYALLEKKVVVLQAGAEVFRANTGEAAHRAIQQQVGASNAYLLISKYQLRQRPSSLDYWRNSAIYNMNLHIFSTKYFTHIAETDNLLLIQRKK